MGKEIPFVSDKIMEEVDRIFYHGPQRAKSHDLRFGQWIINKIYEKYHGKTEESVIHVLFNMENPEFLELVKEYNE